MFGGLLLGARLFASWYSVVSPLAQLAGAAGVGTRSGWVGQRDASCTQSAALM